MDKETGYFIGKKAEDRFEETCCKLGICCRSTKKMKNWSPERDKLIGDFILATKSDGVKTVDVKQSFISKSSILDFKGHFYIIYEDNRFHNGLAIKASILKNIVLKMDDKNFDAMTISKEPGINYARLKSVQKQLEAISLEDFFKEIK